MNETKKEILVSLSLRVGLAFAFFYAAISSFITPQNWIGFFPTFLRNIVPQSFLLTFFSIYEIVLGLWLLSNKKTFYVAVLSAISLFFITVLNWTAMEIVFRDVSILFMAVALAILSKNK